MLLQEGDKNSYYMYKGHSGHLVANPQLIASHFKPLNQINQSTIKNYCIEEANNKTINFPDNNNPVAVKEDVAVGLKGEVYSRKGRGNYISYSFFPIP